MQISPGSRITLLVWLAVMTCLSALAVLRWPSQDWFDTDFQSLLPKDDGKYWVSIANEQAAAAYGGQLVWLIEGKDSRQVSRFATALRQQLDKAGYVDPDFEADQLGRWQNLTEILSVYHRGLITQADYQLLQRDPAAYFERIRRLLYSPLGGVSLSLLTLDPSGLFANYLTHINPDRPDTESKTDGIVSKLIVTRIPPEKLDFTQIPGLYHLYQKLRGQAGQQQLALFATGAPLYTAYGVQSAQREMSTIGLASLTALVTLLLLSLRSVTAVILTLVCTLAGVVAGLLVTVAVLQRIHILTLVFGVSLIGIAADYAIHYFAQSRITTWTPATGLDKVYTALWLSMLSSVTAFSTLLLVPFPGIRQIGLFMGSGLVCSFLTVCLLFPHIYRGSRIPAPLTGIWLRPQWHWRCNAPTFLALLPLALAMAALTQLPASDDVREFYASPPDLDEARDRITEALPQAPDSRYLLLEAPDQLALLRLEERFGKDLRVLQENQVLGGFSGIGTLIPGPETQTNGAALLASPRINRHLAQHMTLMGLDGDLQAQALKSWQQPFEPLQIDALDAMPLPVGVGGFLGCNNDVCASRIRLAGVTTVDEIEAIIKRYPEVRLIDQIADISDSMGIYRSTVSFLLFAAMFLLAAFLSLVCGWRMAVNILATPLITCLLSLLAVSYWQGGYNLVNLMALLLLIGVSLDYAIFRAFTNIEEQAGTTLAISLSAATSILAFGMLGFSETPVLRNFGQTISVGLIIAWLLSWINFSKAVRQ